MGNGRGGDAADQRDDYNDRRAVPSIKDPLKWFTLAILIGGWIWGLAIQWNTVSVLNKNALIQTEINTQINQALVSLNLRLTALETSHNEVVLPHIKSATHE